ncbi:hypothetical protein HOLleu_24985 [Holothuria leucospilota]|uniref:Ig-like domain-containing protein n=1 Tax=Holothuria leucospilota TaxID=206669 RepID=A0A9Q1BRZ0_HOLLE|nr:hypothetical protein HOLleu_24985 [Holothuria leucospilota]
MHKVTLFTCVVVIACLCVQKTYAFCDDEFDENIEGIYGQDISLSCRTSATCNTIQWQNATTKAFISPTETPHTSINRQGRTSVLHISKVTLYNVGSYSCWCYRADRTLHGELCSVSLTAVCQARVLIDGETLIYNSSDPSPAAGYALKVTEHTTLRVECHEDALLETSCALQRDTRQHMGDITAMSFCYISCKLKRESRGISSNCTVNIFIEVQKAITVHHSTTETVPSSSDSAGNLAAKGNPLPIIIPLITVVCVLLVIAIALCVYIFSPKCSKGSRSTENSNPVYPSYNAEVLPTYEMVDKNTDANISANPTSKELGDASTDHSYTYVNTGNDGNFSDQQNVQAVESLVVTNLYSEVNKPDNSGKTNGQAAMRPSPSATQEVYSEVNKRDRVAENDFKTVSEEKKSSTGFEKVTDIQNDNQVAEQHDLSSSGHQILDYEDMDTDTDVNEFAGLYAVVDKTKNKSQQK